MTVTETIRGTQTVLVDVAEVEREAVEVDVAADAEDVVEAEARR